MKKKGIAILCIIGCLLLSACGGQNGQNGQEAGQGGGVQGEVQTQEGQQPQDESGTQKENAGQQGGAAGSLDVSVSERLAFDVLSWDWKEVFQREGQEHFNPTFLGMQHYQGEVVQLWGAQTQLPGDANMPEDCLDVFLCREDGSAEILLQDVSIKNRYRSWYLDGNGYFYTFDGYRAEDEDSLSVCDPDGNVICSQKIDGYIVNICQIPNGKVYLLLRARESGMYGSCQLAEFDMENRKVSVVIDNFGRELRYPYAIGRGENGILCMDQDGFWEVDLADKSWNAYLLFEGTTYYADLGKREVQSIGVTDDGGIEIMRSNGRAKMVGSEENLGVGEVETIKLVDMGRGRTPIVMRGLHFYSDWLKKYIMQFNDSNKDYYVVLEECPDGTDEEDFVRQTQVQIGTGKGPDIMYGELLEESVYSLIQKGVFEDLKPYMDKSGIREEDYFPLAFSNWRDGDKVYSLNLSVVLAGDQIEEGVLGSRTQPDIETLIHALLACEEGVCYAYHADPVTLLRHFLEGSEDLWGMVDWETGSCDFGGELFAGILEASGRFGYDERRHYPAVAQFRYYNVLLYDSLEEQEKEGKVTCGVLFDDGCHAAIDNSYGIITMNANSSCKEGAWELLELLLGEEVQTTLASEGFVPVHKKVFDQEMEEMPANEWNFSYTITTAYGETVLGEKRYAKDLTEEKIADFRTAIEEAKPLPIRTGPILDIICEEAQDYFNGVKGIAEVCGIIENRVNLYLGENS